MLNRPKRSANMQILHYHATTLYALLDILLFSSLCEFICVRIFMQRENSFSFVLIQSTIDLFLSSSQLSSKKMLGTKIILTITTRKKNQFLIKSFYFGYSLYVCRLNIDNVSLTLAQSITQSSRFPINY